MKTKLMLLTAALGLAAATSGRAAILINEFSPNPTGGDPGTQTIELLATAGESNFSGFWGSIEGDTSFDVQDSGSINVSFDLNGIASFSISDLENPTFTFYISTSDHSSATGIGDITTSIDAIGVPDNTTDDLYGATLGGQDFAFIGGEPQLIFRASDTLDWYGIRDPAGSDAYDIDATAVSFTGFSANPSVSTFGAVNPAIPEPSSIIMMGLVGLAAFGILRGRKK